MRYMSIFLIVVTLLTIQCSKKEVAVKSMEGLEAPELLAKGEQAFNEGDMGGSGQLKLFS